MITNSFARQCFVALAVVLGAATPALAQGRTVGVKGGVNVATQQVTPADDSATRRWSAGIVAGAFWTQPVGSRFDVAIEGLYSAKGTRLQIAGLKQTLEVDYLEVPALVRLHFARYYIEGGGAAAVRVRARARIGFAGSTESVDIAREVERADYGVVGGGGFNFGRFVVDARYTHGLKDIDADKTDGSHTRNRAVSITAGVKF